MRRCVPVNPPHHARYLRTTTVLWAGTPFGIAPGLRPLGMSRYPAAPGDKTGCMAQSVAACVEGSNRLGGNNVFLSEDLLLLLQIVLIVRRFYDSGHRFFDGSSFFRSLFHMLTKRQICRILRSAGNSND